VGTEIWIKRDGLTHATYGGNKMRKFEFVFGDVLRKKARVVLTGGGLGSHHTLATAVACQQLGLQAVCAYYCQPITAEVRLNLRRSPPLGIDAHWGGDYVGVGASFAWEYLRWFVRSRRAPYFVYPGASDVLGTLGYVNAAFEIKAQLEAGALPEPDAVFVAVGSCGSIAGLILGARLAGLGSQITGVRIIEEDLANRAKIARLVNRTARYLERRLPQLPRTRVAAEEVHLLEGYMGRGYAHPTEKGRRAIELVAGTEDIPLETTYTGKAMAALLDHAQREPGSRLLFVDTFAENPTLSVGDWRALPERFWPVFDPAHEIGCWCLRARRQPGFCWKEPQHPYPGAKDGQPGRPPET
jgi:D-cysteine desulfhydrase